jgi:hypothetical protein
MLTPDRVTNNLAAYTRVEALASMSFVKGFGGLPFTKTKKETTS